MANLKITLKLLPKFLAFVFDSSHVMAVIDRQTHTHMQSLFHINSLQYVEMTNQWH